MMSMGRRGGEPAQPSLVRNEGDDSSQQGAGVLRITRAQLAGSSSGSLHLVKARRDFGLFGDHDEDGDMARGAG